MTPEIWLFHFQPKSSLFDTGHTFVSTSKEHLYFLSLAMLFLIFMMTPSLVDLC